MRSLLYPPIGFAHRGAQTLARENTLEAFQAALDRGASGLESDVWLTADGVPVLDHDGRARSGLRRLPIGRVTRSGLPAHIPTLAELYDRCGTDFHLSLDVKDAEAVPAVLAVARSAGSKTASREAGASKTAADGQEAGGSKADVPESAGPKAPGPRSETAAAISRLWLCHPDWRKLAAWRELSAEVRLVDSTRLRRIHEGPERRAADLADAGIDCINMHATDWTAGLVTLFHRFERLAFGWDAQFERTIQALIRMGCDALYSDDVDLMVAALKKAEL